MIIKSILEQDGGLTLRGHGETHGNQHLRPRQLSGNSTTIGAKVGILSEPHLGQNSSVFFCVQSCSLRLPEILSSLAIDWGCRQMHLPHATFSHAQSLHSTDDMCAWLKFELRPKRCFHPRVMFHFAPHSTLNTSTSSLLLTSPVLNSPTSPTPDLLFTHPLTH